MQRVHERSLPSQGGASGKFRIFGLNTSTVCAHDRKDLVAQEYLEGAFDEDPELEFSPATAAPQPIAEELSTSVSKEEHVADKPTSAPEIVTTTTASLRCATTAVSRRLLSAAGLTSLIRHGG